VYNAYPRDPLHVISDTPRSIISYRWASENPFCSLANYIHCQATLVTWYRTKTIIS